jgi:hypothetical protein
MSFLISTMLEAEDASAMDLISQEAGLQAILREEGLRAAMQAAARQADARRIARQQEPSSLVRQGPVRPEDVRQEPMRRDDEPHIADSGRFVRGDGSHRRPDPQRANPDPSHAAGSTHVGGDLITNNNPGRPDVSMIGRSRPTKLVRSGKSYHFHIRMT